MKELLHTTVYQVTFKQPLTCKSRTEDLLIWQLFYGFMWPSLGKGYDKAKRFYSGINSVENIKPETPLPTESH